MKASANAGDAAATAKPVLWRDVAVIVLLAAVVIGISAHAPTNLYAYAQRYQAGAAIGILESGNWLLPPTQAGGLPRKGPLYAWLVAPVLYVTGVHDDFTFRLPTVAATVAMALCVYALGRRWYGRQVGLLAACLWLTMVHMGKLAYVGTTDMLLALWITVAVLCVDRLLFHPAHRCRRKWWVLGLWVTMILAGLTKGWGLVNLAVVGGMAALAAGLGPGFQASGAARWPEDAHLVVLRLIGRRWWRAAKAVGLIWGLPLLVGVLMLVLGAMWAAGGQKFADVLKFEVFERATGTGEDPPVSASVPPVLYLLYYTLPVSVFALGSLWLVRGSGWLTRRGPICLPLCWVLAVVVPFSLTHGFRPDYLLPCYAPMALLAAWAVEALTQRHGRGGAILPVLRHAFAAPAVVIGSGVSLLSVAYLCHQQLPELLAELLPVPRAIRPETWWLLAPAAAVGVAALAWGIRSSLRWRLRQVAFAACLGMLGVTFLYTHFGSRHARTGDGEEMRNFARRIRDVIGDDEFATYWTDSLCVRVYLGRFGPLLARPGVPKSLPIEMYLEKLVPNGIRWLVTCDRGLVEMGQAREVDGGEYRVKVRGRVRRFQPLPELLSDGFVIRSEPIRTRYWGRLYLIRLKAGARPYAKPISLGYVAGEAGD